MSEDKSNTMQPMPEKNEGLFKFYRKKEVRLLFNESGEIVRKIVTAIDPPRLEMVPLEKYVWISDFKDGSYLKQFDERDFSFHQFEEIDQSKLLVFIMQSVEDENKRYELHFSPGMKLIHYYRNVGLEIGTPQERKFKLYCFGYEKSGQKVIFSIWPNGEVSIGENHPL
jgi:hypothetical protein